MARHVFVRADTWLLLLWRLAASIDHVDDTALLDVGGCAELVARGDTYLRHNNSGHDKNSGHNSSSSSSSSTTTSSSSSEHNRSRRASVGGRNGGRGEVGASPSTHELPSASATTTSSRVRCPATARHRAPRRTARPDGSPARNLLLLSSSSILSLLPVLLLLSILFLLSVLLLLSILLLLSDLTSRPTRVSSPPLGSMPRCTVCVTWQHVSTTTARHSAQQQREQQRAGTTTACLVARAVNAQPRHALAERHLRHVVVV